MKETLENPRNLILECRYNSILDLIYTLKSNLDTSFHSLPNDPSGKTEDAVGKIIIQLDIFKKQILEHKKIPNVSKNDFDTRHSKLMNDLHCWAIRSIHKIDANSPNLCAEKYASLNPANKIALLKHLNKIKRYSNLEFLKPAEKVSLHPDPWTQGKLIQEQQIAADRNLQFQNVLKNTRELLKNYTLSVSCFLSYAWPSPERPYEAWTQESIKLLCDHLEKAGVACSIDIRDSRQGNTNDFMYGAIEKNNVVLFITDSLHDKNRGNRTNSVRTELQFTEERRDKDDENGTTTFFPVTLSNITESKYFPGLKKFTVVQSIPEEGYTRVFIDLLSGLLGLTNNKAFKEIWGPVEAQFLTGTNKSTPVPFSQLQQQCFYHPANTMPSLEPKIENIGLLKKDILAFLTETLKQVLKDLIIKFREKQQTSMFSRLFSSNADAINYTLQCDFLVLERKDMQYLFESIHLMIKAFEPNSLQIDSMKIAEGKPIPFFQNAIEKIIMQIDSMKELIEAMITNKENNPTEDEILSNHLNKIKLLRNHYKSTHQHLNSWSQEDILLTVLSLFCETKKIIDEIKLGDKTFKHSDTPIDILPFSNEFRPAKL